MSRLNRDAIQEQIRLLTDSICDGAFDPAFEDLLDRIVAEPTCQGRRKLANALGDIVSSWSAEVSEVAVALCAFVAGLKIANPALRLADLPGQPAGEPPDAA